jgi:hypothetical protein
MKNLWDVMLIAFLQNVFMTVEVLTFVISKLIYYNTQYNDFYMFFYILLDIAFL